MMGGNDYYFSEQTNKMLNKVVKWAIKTLEMKACGGGAVNLCTAACEIVPKR
jgi:hypothetical protein